MIGKLIAHGNDRRSALARMCGALTEIVVEGIQTNIQLHREIVTDAAFSEGGTDIHYLEKKLGL
jgi:acetyl-CoA carboxylase biotin carboxylase subunit